MSDSSAFIIVAPNARLGCKVASTGLAKPIQLRSLTGLQKKLERYSAAFLLLEWNSADGETPLRTLNALRHDFPRFRFVVFCPDLPERTVADAETLRFLLLESGATAVFANRRELTLLTDILRKHFDDHPEPAKDRIREIREFLPWS